ncbi:EamA family transporter [Actinomadura sp. LD22]|uniref:EamA family transporter n=1 Tax=Actinomadura physcomitrii TaxID=2650748 RepID=A0A6I4M643_9ACTN|nr:EamA family transporter [Actinomadura physcomitrii]
MRTSRASRRACAPANQAGPRALGGAADILLAASLWGTTGTARTFAPGASSVSVAAARIVIGGLLLLALAAATRRDGLRRLLRGRSRLGPLAVGAVAIAVYQVAFFAAVSRTGVAVGTVEHLGGTARAGLALLAAGLAVLVVPVRRARKRRPRGHQLV